MTTQNTLWLIDDDPALRLILEDTFSDAGLNVKVFSGAKGAWAKLNDVLHGHAKRSTLPDVILTDIRMPMMDGLSFSEWVHNHFEQLPIVVMTAHSDLKSAVDSYQTGAFEYLPKPFDLDDAVSVIKKAIRPKRATETESANQIPNRPNPSQTTDSDDTSTLTHTTADSVKSSSQQTGDNKADAHKTDAHKTNAKNADTQNSASKQTPSAKNNSNNSRKRAKKPTSKQTDQSLAEKTTIIGQSLAMQAVFKAIGRLATSPITVLITGESGTGKELVASALHRHSPRSNKPFIALNMAAIPHDLIESELFGHEKGAFTGATTQRQGRFEQANGGTLFLDEIGDMPFSTQTRLLRVLANGEFFRVGGQKPIQVDVRIIAATHQNLEQLVKEGKFREDLFYRLNVIRLPLPPLRARRDDIPELTNFFMARAAKEMGTEQKQLSQEALHLMQAFNWPGNVRQIENACRWITVMATGDMVMIEDLPPELTEFAQQQSTSLFEHPEAFAPYTSAPYSSSSVTDISASHISNEPQPELKNSAYAAHSKPEQAAQPPTNVQSASVHAANQKSPYDAHLDNNNPAYPNTQFNPQSNLQHNPQSEAQSNAQSIAASNTPLNAPLNVKPNAQTNIQNATQQTMPTLSHPVNNSTWQQLLQNWTTQALQTGQTDILQTVNPEFERILIEVALKHTKGRKGEAAELLGWGRNTLTRKIKLLGINK